MARFVANEIWSSPRSIDAPVQGCQKLKFPLLQLHIATFLFSLSATVAQLSSLDVLLIVEARAGLAALALLLWAHFNSIDLCIPQEQRLWFLLIGLLLAFHWYTFFLSMHFGNVAVGLLTFSCFPLFVIFLSAFVDKVRLRLRDFGLLLVLLFGVNLLIPPAATGNHGWVGPLLGVASGFSFALIQLINHRLVKHRDPVAISIYQNGIAAIVLLPFFHASMLPSTPQAVIQLLFLGLICTAVAHTMFIAAMRGVSARTASLFSYLEPVYGIGMAALLLGEMPNVRTLAGGALILFSIFLATRSDLP